MTTITLDTTMEVLYYAVGVIGSFKILKGLFKPNEKIEVIIEEEDYFGDSELERKNFDEDGFPIASFYYDNALYEANDSYANMVDRKIYDEEYQPDYGQYCEIESEEKRAE
tara:strand:+ start:757 stop:1089 length:333 start_codon:yes stop_codon:yes gene_type:complete